MRHRKQSGHSYPLGKRTHGIPRILSCAAISVMLASSRLCAVLWGVKKREVI